RREWPHPVDRDTGGVLFAVTAAYHFSVLSFVAPIPRDASRRIVGRDFLNIWTLDLCLARSPSDRCRPADRVVDAQAAGRAVPGHARRVQTMEDTRRCGADCAGGHPVNAQAAGRTIVPTNYSA